VGPIRIQFARLCRETRTMLDVTQLELAEAAGVSRSLIAEIEAGRGNPSLDVVSRIGDALGLELDLSGRLPINLGPKPRDAVHARCSGYVDRRLRSAGWQTRREIAVSAGRIHGWIDLLAFDPRSGALLIVEIKTRLDDLGAIERQIGWYERCAVDAAFSLGWQPRTVSSWLLMLASEEVDDGLRRYRDVLRVAFPRRAAQLREDLVLPVRMTSGQRGLALIDPTSRRRDWLLPSRSEGRRTAAPYRDYGDAAQRLG